MQAWEGHPPLTTEQLSFLLCLECSSHIITAQLCSPCIHWPAASTASWSLQGSRARLQGALGFTQVFLGQSDTRICCFLTVLCQLVHCPQSWVLHWPWTPQGSRKGKALVWHFRGALVPPALLHQLTAEAELEQLDAPLVSWGRIGSCYTKGWRGNKARHLSHGTISTATAEKPRQAGLWEFSFPHQKKGWEMFKVSVCLNLTRLKDDES